MKLPNEPASVRKDERQREQERAVQRANRTRLELRLYALLACIALVILWAIGHAIRSH